MLDQLHVDTLTGLFNFRHFHEALEVEISRSERTGQSLGMLMLDLDHFKQVNDTHGHETGNRVLRHTADLLRAGVRRIDIPCRYGGEEFIVILPAIGLRTLVKVAERVRKDIESTPLELGDMQVPLTASFGVDVREAGDSDCAAAFIERVDRLLYRAKETGRNQVCHLPLGVRAEQTQVSVDEKKLLLRR